jgi:hypothetical protein
MYRLRVAIFIDRIIFAMNSDVPQLSRLGVGDRESPGVEHWQPHRHGRSLPQLALNFNLTALQIDATLHDDQTESGARPVGNVMSAMKSVKEPLAIGFRNADPSSEYFTAFVSKFVKI